MPKTPAQKEKDREGAQKRRQKERDKQKQEKEKREAQLLKDRLRKRAEREAERLQREAQQQTMTPSTHPTADSAGRQQHPTLSTPNGTISTPVSDHRTPAPIQSGWPYSNSSGTVTAAIHSQPTTPSHLDVLLPAMASGTPSEVNRFLKFRALNIAAEGLNRTVESIRAEDEEPRRNLTYLSEQQPQLPTSVQQQQQLDSKPAAAVTPEPFDMDRWSAHNQEEFNKLYMGWYGYACGGEIKNAEEFDMLAFRFFAFAVVECPNFLESFFVSNAGSPPTTRILDYLAEKKWINEKTAEALVSFIKERYIPHFQAGMAVNYRKLDMHGRLELVEAVILSVHNVGVQGSYTIQYQDENGELKDKDTTIHRIQYK